MITQESDNKLINENHSKEDKVWIVKGYQTSDLKYATFDNSIIDDQLKTDITYEILVNDFKSCNDVIIQYRKDYVNLLQSNPHKIIDSFKLYELKFVNFEINAFLLQRQLELMSYVIKLKFCNNDEDEAKEKEDNDRNNENEKGINYFNNNYMQMIIKHFENKNIDDLMLIWTSDETFKKIIFNEIDDMKEIREVFAQGLENEKFILQYSNLSVPTPSICGLGVMLKYLKMILERSIENIRILNIKITEDAMLDFFQDCTKLQSIGLMVKNTFRVPQNDIFNLNESSDEWVKLKSNYERIVVHSSYTIKKKLQILFDLLNLGNAAVSTGYKFNSTYLKVLGTGYFMAYYFFNSKHAQLEVKKFAINPKFEIAQRMWNLLDTNGIKQLYSKSLIGVKFRKKLYLRRYEEEITKEFIANQIEQINSNKSDNIDNFIKQSSHLNDNSHYTRKTNEIQSSRHGEETFITSVKPDQAKKFVKVKLLHNREIFIEKIKGFSIFDCCINKVNFTRDSLIIHIHGGGWVAMSSSSHESYLRKWTKELDCPIISIDYRLAPFTPYPGPLDDVWQAYNWIINHAKEEFDINLNKIILVGDSAGGNLVLGLVYLLILNNRRLPDSVILAYPGLRTNIEYFNPSYLITFHDKILPYFFLRFCLDSYLNDYKNKDDPFLEPILMNEKILRRLPPVRIVCGSSDPLRDDIINFTHILTKLHKDCKLYELKYFPHGFLNFDNPHMLPEAKIGNDIIIREMEKVISSIK